MNTPADKPDLPDPDYIHTVTDGWKGGTVMHTHYWNADTVLRLLADERRKALDQFRPAVMDAIDLLTLDADALRDCSTHFSDGDYDWTGEPDAKVDYDRMLRVVDALRLLIDRKEPT